MRILSLGDSYTIGEGVPEAARWPERLAALLRARGLAVERPEIVARTGWTGDELEAAVEAAPLRAPYALVTLLVGVNDQYRGRSPADGAAAFARLLARAVALAGGEGSRVLVLSIPDWGVTPYASGRDRAAIARGIDAWNAMERDAAARAGAGWLDVTALSRVHGVDPAWLARDALHPGPAAHAAWAEAALPAAERALAPRVGRTRRAGPAGPGSGED